MAILDDDDDMQVLTLWQVGLLPPTPEQHRREFDVLVLQPELCQAVEAQRAKSPTLSRLSEPAFDRRSTFFADPL